MRLAARAPPPPLLSFEVWCKRDAERLSNNHSKSERRGAKGWIYKILGGFRNSCFFEIIVIGEKLVSNLQECDFRHFEIEMPVFWERVGE